MDTVPELQARAARIARLLTPSQLDDLRRRTSIIVAGLGSLPLAEALAMLPEVHSTDRDVLRLLGDLLAHTLTGDEWGLYGDDSELPLMLANIAE